MSAMIILHSQDGADLFWKDTSGAFDRIVEYLMRDRDIPAPLLDYLREYRPNGFFDLTEFDTVSLRYFVGAAHRLFDEINQHKDDGGRRYMLISLGHLIRVGQQAMRANKLLPVAES